MPKKLTQEIFIERSEKDERLVDANNVPYDFSKSIYINNRTKVIVNCRLHGSFSAPPSDLQQGQGCNKCGYLKSSEKRSAEAKAKFAEKGTVVHDNKYDYSKVKYKNSQTKVEIICPAEGHGSFWQTPTSHLSKGSGCPACGNINRNLSSNMEAKATFAERATKKHAAKYDYSKVIYINNKTKVEIICLVEGHGSFWQTPNNHLHGDICPTCSIEAFTGEGHPGWIENRDELVDGKRIGGITTWAKAVKRGVKYCDCCDTKFTKDNRPIAHHLNSYKDFPEQRLDVENGVALCFACHIAFHKQYGFGGNTAEQYYEYKFK